MRDLVSLCKQKILYLLKPITSLFLFRIGQLLLNSNNYIFLTNYNLSKKSTDTLRSCQSNFTIDRSVYHLLITSFLLDNVIGIIVLVKIN